MHQNYYDHSKKRDLSYQQDISNIAYRFGFKVIYEEDRILKVEDGKTTVIVTSEEARRNTLCYKAWKILKEEYGFWGDKMDNEFEYWGINRYD